MSLKKTGCYGAIFIIATLPGYLSLSGLGASAHAQALPAEVTAKAKELKEADNKYIKALCDGSKAERSAARTVRERLQGELIKVIGNVAVQSSDVQKALDVASDAGDIADKVAANKSATDREKAEAQAKFQVSKNDLQETVAKARTQIEAQLGKYPGVTLAARDDCPDKPKNAEKAKATQQRAEKRRAPEGSAAPASSVGGGFSFGGGGAGVSFGR